MSKYSHTIDVIPLDKYHFSDERKYRSQMKKDSNGSWKRKLVQDYIQRSRVFPQQTTIVGALRYLILYINKQIPIKDLTAAKRMVGEKSWSLDSKNIDLGMIKSISPVMLYDGDTGYDYLINSLHFYSSEAYVAKERELQTSKAIMADGSKLIKWRDHDDKTYYDRHLQKVMDSDDCICFFQEKIDSNNDIENKHLRDLEYGPFVTSKRIGIDKVKNQNEANEAFYKSEDYKMHNGSCFRCYANLSIENDMEEIIPIGADGHLFKVKISKKECTHTFEELTPGNHAVSLISDSFLNNDQYKVLSQKAILIASDTVPFGHIKTTNNTNSKYYTKNPQSGKGDNFKLESANIKLLKAGSIFYFNNDQDVKMCAEYLQAHEKMRMIGYNMFWNHHYKINN